MTKEQEEYAKKEVLVQKLTRKDLEWGGICLHIGIHLRKDVFSLVQEDWW